MKLKEKDDEIILRSNITIYSFGELISIKLISKENKENKYLISSKPLIGFTIIDYGKNLKNIQKIDTLIIN